MNPQPPFFGVCRSAVRRPPVHVPSGGVPYSFPAELIAQPTTEKIDRLAATGELVSFAMMLALLLVPPRAFWWATRQEEVINPGWQWLPCLLVLTTGMLALYRAVQGDLNLSVVTVQLVGGYIGRSLERWHAVDVRAVLLAAAGLAAVVPLMVASRSWAPSIPNRLRVATHLAIWLAVSGFVALSSAITDSRGQTLGTGVALFVCFNPITLKIIRACLQKLPRWLENGWPVGVYVWSVSALSLWGAAIVLWLAKHLVSIPASAAVQQSAFSLAQLGTAVGLALCVLTHTEGMPWWRRAWIPTTLTIGGFLAMGEHGSLMELGMFATPALLVLRGVKRDALLCVFGMAAAGLLIACTPTAQARWNDLTNARPLPELQKVRDALLLAGWIGGADARYVAAWTGRDYILAGIALSEGKAMVLAVCMAFAALIHHVSESVVTLRDQPLRAIGIAICLLWFGQFVVCVGPVVGITPFTGVAFPLAARSVAMAWMVVAGLAVLVATAQETELMEDHDVPVLL